MLSVRMSDTEENVGDTTIDELLDGDDDEDDLTHLAATIPKEDTAPEVKVKEEKAEKDDDIIKESCESFGPAVHCVDEVQNEDNDVFDEDVVEEKVKPVAVVPDLADEKRNVFMSSNLDDAVSDGKDTSRLVNIEPNNAIEGIHELSKDEEEKIRKLLDEREYQEGVKAGLGLKKKSADRMGRMTIGNTVYVPSKAKTLAEKRKKLQEDMMKYGVAAIERLYPRQQKKNLTTKKSFKQKMGLFKMKPLASDLDFEEVDARSIIKPFSHHKYIQEPVMDTVVYINRRDGLVPLSTLCKESNTVLSSNVSLVSGRNVTLGKPACYVRESNRLVAVGGTRNTLASNIRILNLPKFDEDKSDFNLFNMDNEYASFAASALSRPQKRMDIRQLKKKTADREKVMMRKMEDNRSLIDRMIMKLNIGEDVGKAPEVSSVKVEDDESKEDIKNIEPEIEASKNIESSLDESQDTDSQTEYEEDEKIVVSNAWKNTGDQAFPSELNMDECPPLRGFHEGNIKPAKKEPILNTEGQTGWDGCDVDGCFCKSARDPGDASASTTNSGGTTPLSAKDKKKTAHAQELKRVKRALKTLGVNVIEFYDYDTVDLSCTRDYCKFGCVCDSIKMKPIPPTHCGKVECMFECSCSKEALKYSSCGNRRVNISAAVGARIQEDSQRFMTAEEKKFTNTVVLTADRDTVMLGGRGTKRERKIPQRYQNSTSIIKDSAGQQTQPSLDKSEEEDDEPEILEDSLQEVRKELDIIPCTVVIPKVNLPSTTEVWCMFHSRYSCPCKVYENPLDYAPDVSKSRNKAKRSIGGKFLTKKQDESEISVDNGYVDELIGSDQEEDPIDKDDKDYSPAKKQIKLSPSSESCSRTSVLTKPRSTGTKMPFKPSEKGGAVFQEIASISDRDRHSEGKTSKVSQKTLNSGSMTDINFDVTKRNSVQYARWDVLKEKFQDGELDYYLYCRPVNKSGRPSQVIILVAKGQKCYVASAINIRKFDGGKHKLPNLVEACLQPLNKEEDKMTYAVLHSNGLNWTLQSLLTSQNSIKSGVKRKLEAVKPPPPKMKKISPPKDSTTQVDIGRVSQKLPIGQSMVTVTKKGKPLMQVKLPATQPNQHWTLISSGAGEQTIQCPDSPLVLKCAILQQAANLASATNTTVRIPISVEGQVSAFGVYAVPGLKTHVFVGPFSMKDAKEKDDTAEGDVICLEDEEDSKDSAQDEVVIVEDKEKKVTEEQNSIKEKTMLLGQTPQLISKEIDEDVNDKSEIQVVDDTPEEVSQAETLMKDNKTTAQSQPVHNIPTYKYGKVVKIKDKVKWSERGTNFVMKHIHKGKNRTIECSVDCNGRVAFLHPDMSDHVVLCSSKANAYKWLKEFEILTKHANASKEKTVKELPKVLLLDEKRGGIKKKLMCGMLIQTRQEKEESKLFYELGQNAFRQFFTKSTTKEQILKKARNEIETLSAETKLSEQNKGILMKKRSKLFDTFTKSLEGLPLDKKKIAIQNLKRLMSSKEKPKVPEKSKQDDQSPKKVEIIMNKTKDLQNALTTVAGSLTPYTDVTGINPVRSDGSIIKPLSAFALWSREKKGSYLAQGMSPDKLAGWLGKTWALMNDKSKERYVKEAGHLKILHSLQHPQFYTQAELRLLHRGVKANLPLPKADRLTGQQPSNTNSQTEPKEQLPEIADTFSMVSPSTQADSQVQTGIQPSTPVTPKSPSVIADNKTATPSSSTKVMLSSTMPSKVMPDAVASGSQGTSVINQTAHILSKRSQSTRPAPGLLPISAMADSQSPQYLPASNQVSSQRVQKQMNMDESSEGTLDLSEIPSDAADVLGLALQTSGLQEISEPTAIVSHEAWAQEQYKLEEQILCQSLVAGKQQQQHMVFFGDESEQETVARRPAGGQQPGEVIHISGDNFVLSEDGQQLILTSEAGGGQQIILESDPEAQSEENTMQMGGQPQSRQMFVQQSVNGQLYIRGDAGGDGEVFLPPAEQAGQSFVQAESDSQVYTQAENAPIYAEGESVGNGEVYLHTSADGESVYLDDMGRQVVFHQDQNGGQYYMQNGEIFQIVNDDVTQID